MNRTQHVTLHPADLNRRLLKNGGHIAIQMAADNTPKDRLNELLGAANK